MKFSPDYIITNKDYPLNYKFLKNNFKSKIIQINNIFNSHIFQKKKLVNFKKIKIKYL